jgi:hypothetical protein
MSKRWNYQTIEIKTGLLNNRPSVDAIQQELTRHGNLGWELVNIVALPMSPALLVFKKEA